MREELSIEDYNEYHILKAELEKFGFYEEVEDQWFKQYLAEMSKLETFQNVEYTNEEQGQLLEQSKRAAQRVLEKMKKELK